MSGFKTLKEEALEANLEIKRQNLAIYTWGNASAFDPVKNVFAIKPSGVPYDKLNTELMIVVDIDGKIVEGKLNPSSDTKTHMVLYRNFPGIRGITHTHSPYAAAWAQAGMSVPIFGTTHADHGTENIPCTKIMSPDAVKNDYELETGNLIVEHFKKENLDYSFTEMVLVAGHGPFTWGAVASQSVYHAAVLEEICKIAFFTININPKTEALPEYIIRKHWERKHGPGAYYGNKL